MTRFPVAGSQEMTNEVPVTRVSVRPAGNCPVGVRLMHHVDLDSSGLEQ